jgi:hypothetical protein
MLAFRSSRYKVCAYHSKELKLYSERLLASSNNVNNASYSGKCLEAPIAHGMELKS